MTLSYEPDYSDLLGLLVALCESQAGTSIPAGDEWKNDVQALSIKLHHHLYSMRAVADGAIASYWSGASLSFIDHSSVKVLARAALETYLTFAYIYSASGDEQAKLQHACWELGGLLDRQKFYTITIKGAQVKASELKQIDALRDQLQNNELFLKKVASERKKLLNGEWRGGRSWVDIGIAAGFNPKYIRNIYGYLCGYSHSSWLSLLQVAQAKTMAQQKGLADAIMGIGVVIMAHYASSYVRLFPSAENVLKSSPLAAKVAEKWRFSAEDMAGLYGS